MFLLHPLALSVAMEGRQFEFSVGLSLGNQSLILNVELVVERVF